MSGRVAVKYLHVDVWTNMALRRALKVLERVDQEMIRALGDGVPAIASMRGELRDLLARRRREHIGCGPRAAASWKQAIAAAHREDDKRNKK